MKYGLLNQRFLSTLCWTETLDYLQSNEFARMWSLAINDMDMDNDTYEWLHPMILAAKANAEDNPSWEEAMNGPLAEGYWKAAEAEIDTLESMEVWVGAEGWCRLPTLGDLGMVSFRVDLEGRFGAESKGA